MNPTLDWVVANMPPPNHESRYYPYAYVFKGAYGFQDNKKAGTQVRKDLEEYVNDIFYAHRCAVQIGAHSNGTRGIRLMNCR